MRCALCGKVAEPTGRGTMNIEHDLAKEALTEVFVHVTAGLFGRWSGCGKASNAAVGRVGCTVVVDRAVTAGAGSEIGIGAAAGAGPAGVVRDLVRAAHRHSMGVPAASVRG